VSVLPYQTTKVPVSRTQSAIFEMVRAHGATDFMFTDVHDPAKSGVMFAVRFGKDGPKLTVRLEAKTDGIIRELRGKQRYTNTDPKYASPEQREQAQRMAWRVLHDEVKARLVAVRYGVIDFVRAFMADILPAGTNRTIGDRVSQVIETGGDVRKLLPGGFENNE